MIFLRLLIVVAAIFIPYYIGKRIDNNRDDDNDSWYESIETYILRWLLGFCVVCGILLAIILFCGLGYWIIGG